MWYNMLIFATHTHTVIYNTVFWKTTEESGESDCFQKEEEDNGRLK